MKKENEKFIIRGEHSKEKPYTVISNLIARANLHPFTKGIFLEVLSFSDNYQFHATVFYKKYGRKLVDKAINELIEKGFCKKIKVNYKTNHYYFYEESILDNTLNNTPDDVPTVQQTCSKSTPDDVPTVHHDCTHSTSYDVPTVQLISTNEINNKLISNNLISNLDYCINSTLDCTSTNNNVFIGCTEKTQKEDLEKVEIEKNTRNLDLDLESSKFIEIENEIEEEIIETDELDFDLIIENRLNPNFNLEFDQKKENKLNNQLINKMDEKAQIQDSIEFNEIKKEYPKFNLEKELDVWYSYNSTRNKLEDKTLKDLISSFKGWLNYKSINSLSVDKNNKKLNLNQETIDFLESAIKKYKVSSGCIVTHSFTYIDLFHAIEKARKETKLKKVPKELILNLANFYPFKGESTKFHSVDNVADLFIQVINKFKQELKKDKVKIEN